ncbi:MAG: PQ loop repeat protein [Candidatus Argoarchaeum ethanivorans]|uniref:PQ loop repeat protein n=1 Tax=Candidatus Argoarchaeum ethanivorans TaxID=2608793 RepID=A0A811TA61_9EURY|nr:MAG: PQ loop repeat protein [Candidatus Argoarchaeum ethanivorans]
MSLNSNIMNLITILGLVAATCTTISFLPQAIKTIRSKHTKDLSFGMYTVLTIGVFLWFVYGIFIKDIPVILANGITLVFTATILYLIIKYK